MKSEFTPRDKNDVKNLLTGNFNSVPRFYKIMLGSKFVRIRNVNEQLGLILKKTTLRVQSQSVVQTSFVLLLVLQVSGCFWRVGSDFNLDSPENWISDQSLSNASTLD